MYEYHYRQVTKFGISYYNRRFWHRDLALHIGQRVIVYGDPQVSSNYIEVYLPKGSWLCTARKLDHLSSS